jgi:hypothetical protein
MRILGIDPGITGAFALYRDGEWILFDMPIAGDAKHHEINGPEVCRWLREQAPDHAFIEFASARPGQGVTSMFRFGCAYGGLKMALAACGVPFTIVTPTLEEGARRADRRRQGSLATTRTTAVSRSSRQPSAQEGSPARRCDVAGVLRHAGERTLSNAGEQTWKWRAERSDCGVTPEFH